MLANERAMETILSIGFRPADVAKNGKGPIPANFPFLGLFPFWAYSLYFPLGLHWGKLGYRVYSLFSRGLPGLFPFFGAFAIIGPKTIRCWFRKYILAGNSLPFLG